MKKYQKSQDDEDSGVEVCYQELETETKKKVSKFSLIIITNIYSRFVVFIKAEVNTFFVKPCSEAAPALKELNACVCFGVL